MWGYIGRLWVSPMFSRLYVDYVGNFCHSVGWTQEGMIDYVALDGIPGSTDTTA